jgi:hypothetical protein
MPSASLLAWAAMSYDNAMGTKYWGLLLLTEFLAVWELMLLLICDEKSRAPLIIGLVIGIATYFVLGAFQYPAQIAAAGLIGLLIVILYDAEKIM